jgi:hypothetical protein
MMIEGNAPAASPPGMVPSEYHERGRLLEKKAGRGIGAMPLPRLRGRSFETYDTDLQRFSVGSWLNLRSFSSFDGQSM